MRSIAGAIFVYTATTAYYSRPALFLPGGQATLVDRLIPIVEAAIGLLAGVIVDAVARRRSLTNPGSACDRAPPPSAPQWDGD